MQSKWNKLRIRIGLALRQNRLPIAFVTAWLLVNFGVFVRVGRMTPGAAALLTACIAKSPGGWAGAYQSFTEFVVFGLVASLVLTNVTRRYRPEETSRALAARSNGHVVVVGHNHLGRRIREIAVEAKTPVVVVDPSPEAVAALVREEEPVVIGSPRDASVLAHAAIDRAKVVVVATEDLETAAVACRLVREQNETCELVVRCADDDVGAVLARTYRARAISTSKLAAAFIQAHALKARARSAVVLGRNDVGERVAASLADKQIAVRHVETTEDPAALAAAGVAEADLVVLCDDDLGKNLIRVDRIRDLNARAKIVCRAFHEDAAQILARDPFRCLVLSTSRHAAEALVRAGVFREVGVDRAAYDALRAAGALAPT